MRARLIPGALMIFCAFACSRQSMSSGAPSPNAPDSLNGVVTIVGSDPLTWLSLQPAEGGMAIRLEGAAAEPLRMVSAAFVSVMGRRTSGSFVVSGFIVRRVDGQAVNDGVVTQRGNVLSLVLIEGGSIDLVQPSTGFFQLIRARIWMTVRQDGIAPSFGVISPAPTGR